MSSLTTALSIAGSGMRTAQAATSIVSANVTNADTEGYTRKIAAKQTQVTAGTASGVDLATVTSTVSKTLMKQLVAAASASGAAAQTDNYLSQLDSAYGSTTESTGVAAALTSLMEDIESLSLTTDSSSLGYSVVSSLQQVVSEVNAISSTIQTLRQSTEQDTADAVQRINSGLTELDSLNEQIAKARANGQSTADLEDQRWTALQSLSADINVQYYVDSGNQLHVCTAGGTVLLNSDAATLDFDQAGTMSASATYAGGQLSGITVNGKDITAEITSGTLGALLELRDKTLLARQAELDSLATTLAETLNAISNQGSALPAPSSLAGTQAVSASDAFSATGTARIAVVSSDGTVADVLDLDLSNYATVSDLVSAIDAMASVDAALDADGHLVLTATDSSTGVALSEMDSAVGAGGEGWSSYFGLNDLLVVDDNGRLSVRDDILADSGLLPLASLSTEAGIAAGDIGLSSGGTTITAKLSEAMSISHQFAAAGAAGATQATFSDYFADLVGVTATLSDKAADTANAKEQIVSSLESTFSSASGVNVDEELAELTALETLYNASATVMQVVQQMYDTLMDII